MEAWSALGLSSFKNEELFGIVKDFEAKLLEYPEVLELAAIKDLQDKLKYFKVEVMGANPVTYADLEAADISVDQVVRGIRIILHTFLSHPLVSVREAAFFIWQSIEQYGNPTSLDFNEEYSVIIRLIETFESIPKEMLETTQLVPWVAELRARYELFMSLMSNYEADRFSIRRVKSTRLELCESWKNVRICINALSIMQPSTRLNNLISELNEYIQSKRTTLRMRKTQN